MEFYKRMKKKYKKLIVVKKSENSSRQESYKITEKSFNYWVKKYNWRKNETSKHRSNNTS